MPLGYKDSKLAKNQQFVGDGNEQEIFYFPN